MQSADDIENELDALYARCGEAGDADELRELTTQFFGLIRDKVLEHPDGVLQAHAFNELSSLLGNIDESQFWNPKFRQFWWDSVDALMLRIVELEDEASPDGVSLHLFILGYWRDIIYDNDDERYVRLLSYLKHPRLARLTVEVYLEAVTMDWLPESLFKRFRCFPVNLFREYERLRDRLDFTLKETMYELIESYCGEMVWEEPSDSEDGNTSLG